MDRRRPRNPPTRPLVLIVEGHEDTRMLYALALSGMGFEVVAEPSLTDAFRRAWDVHPDVIVTALPMPNDDGPQFLQQLKQNPRTRDIPVVGVSGCAQQMAREHAERNGFAACLPMPCLPAELAAGLRQVLDATTHAQRPE
jgi:CheY-like chemotaxis protein